MATTGTRARVELARVRQAVHWAQRELELTDDELGGAIGVSSRSIVRWRAANHRPSARNLLAAEQLLELAQALASAFGSDRRALQEWLHQPLAVLRRRSPLRAVLSGDVANVVSVLADAESGTFA